MKTVLITGGSRGIGKAMVELFCEKGYLVAFTYKNSAEAASIGLYLKLRALEFGLRSGKGCAEGFRVLGVTHMHCLPEAGN